MRTNVVKLLVAGVLLFGGMLLLGLLVTHVVVPGGVGHLDDSIERDLLAYRTSTLNSFTDFGTRMGNTMTVVIELGVVVVVLGLALRRWWPPLFLVAALAGESSIYFLTSSLIPRDRPHIARFGPADPVASYPSGHVAASVCLYGGVAVLAWQCTRNRPLQIGLTALASVVILVVGFSRMYRGYHHLTDVLAGALLGGTWLWLCARYLLAQEGRRWSR
jgi:membrane-associated phospholipid phosphatase